MKDWSKSVSFDNVRIVLINPSHPGNIGAAARAMKTMCLQHLYLVEPRVFPHADATARAAGADDILARANVCKTLDEALGDCELIIGASARKRSISCPVLGPEECAKQLELENKAHNIAIMFGREHSGLTNKEVDRCHNLIHIPTNGDFSSLNLASAVQIVAYELLKAKMALKNVLSVNEVEINDISAQDRPETQDQRTKPATVEEMELFYAHLEQTLIRTEFIDPEAPRHIMRRLRRLFNRAHPEVVEVNILRGILTAMQEKLN